MKTFDIKIKLELNDEQAEDLALFKKIFKLNNEDGLFKFKKTREGTINFAFVDSNYIFRIGTEPLLGALNKPTYTPMLIENGICSISEESLTKISPFFPKIKELFHCDKTPFNLQLKSELWISIAPMMSRKITDGKMEAV